MKYGVIVCPRCKQVKGVELRYKSTNCIKCNKSVKLDKVRILFETNSKEKLSHAIGLVNADFDGNLNDFKKIFEKKI